MTDKMTLDELMEWIIDRKHYEDISGREENAYNLIFDYIRTNRAALEAGMANKLAKDIINKIMESKGLFLGINYDSNMKARNSIIELITAEFVGESNDS